MIKLFLSYDNIDPNLGSKFVHTENSFTILNLDSAITKHVQFDEWNYGSKDYYGEYKDLSPLYWAIKKENIEIVKLLLSCEKIDINQISYCSFNGDLGFEKTLLFFSIEENNIDIMNLLLSNEKIDVNMVSKVYEKEDDDDDVYKYKNYVQWEYIKTPLYYAVEKEKIDVIKILLSRGDIDLNYICKGQKLNEKNNYIGLNAKPAFNLAIENENIEIINLLLENQNIDVNIKSIQNSILI